MLTHGYAEDKAQCIALLVTISEGTMSAMGVGEAIAYAVSILPEWTPKRPTSLRIHRRKAVSGIPFLGSGQSSPSAPCPKPNNVCASSISSHSQLWTSLSIMIELTCAKPVPHLNPKWRDRVILPVGLGAGSALPLFAGNSLQQAEAQR